MYETNLNAIAYLVFSLGGYSEMTRNPSDDYLPQNNLQYLEGPSKKIASTNILSSFEPYGRYLIDFPNIR